MTGTLDKIKNALTPGHKHDKEHATETGAVSDTTHHSTVADESTRRKSSVTGASGERKGSIGEGVGRQLFNPNGDKFSEASYGPVGSHSAVETLPASVTSEQYLYTDQTKAKKEHGILRQILNPHGDKYDETKFGSTASTEPPTLSSHDESTLYSTPQANNDRSVLRQILNPSGEKYDPLMHGGHTASNDPSVVDDNLAPINDEGGRFGSVAGLAGRHGSIAAGAERKESVTYGHRPSNAGFAGTSAAAPVGGATASSGLTHHQHNQFSTPEYGHSSAATGAATGTAHHHHHESLAPEAALASSAAAGGGVASHNAGAGALSHHVHNNVYDTASPRAGAPVAGTGATSDLPAVPNTDGKLLGESAAPGGSASIAGTSTERSFPLAGGASSSLPDRSVAHESSGSGHGREGLAAAAGAATVASAAAVKHEHAGHGHEYRGANIDSTPTGGPHATRTANLLDPSLEKSVAGSDPTASALATEPGTAQPGTNSSTATGSSHHHGRDAAIAGGVGAGAVGAYEASKHTSGSSTGPASSTIGPHDKDWKNVVDPRVQPEPSQMKTSGPDASGPASNTIGPHDKDWKNVVDPRVQPEPSLQKQTSTKTDTGPASKTIGPHDKNWMNILDPRVKPQPALMKGDQTAPEATGVAHPTANQAKAAGLATGTAGAAGVGAGLASHSSATGSAVPPSEEQAATGPVTTSEPRSEHHHGRDAAVLGGTGAAGLAAQKAWKKHEHPPVQGERGMQSEANPYSAHALDPRVDGGAAATKSTGSGHHYGRDAAIAGGALGAGGVGAHELGKHHGEEVADKSLQAQEPALQHPLASKAGTTSTDPTSTSGHHYGRDAAIAGGALGAGGVGAHELSQHHGEQVAGEGLGAHDPSLHHGTAPATAAGTSTDTSARQATLDHPSAFEQAAQAAPQTDATASVIQAHATDAPQHPTNVDNFNDSGKLDPLFVPGRDVPAPGSQTYHGEHRPDEKLDSAREQEAQRAHDDAGESSSAPKKRNSILGFLGIGKDKSGQGHDHDEDATEPHLHSGKERNRLHKDPPAGHPAAEGTTIGTGSTVTAETVGRGRSEEVTKTGRELGN